MRSTDQSRFTYHEILTFDLTFRFVWILVVILFVVAWPISKLLDCLLGSHHATFFRRSEIKAIVDIHGPTAEVLEPGDNEEALTLDEVLIIKVCSFFMSIVFL